MTNGVRKKGEWYFDSSPNSPPRQRIAPPYGQLKSYTYCAGVHVLALGGAPMPTLERVEGRWIVGRNLGIELEVWLRGYDDDIGSYAELSAQLAQSPAHLGMYERDGLAWIQGKPWDYERNPPHNTVGGAYFVTWPSSWKDCRGEQADSNVGFTTVCEGEGCLLGVYIAGFEYLFARNRRVQFKDKSGEFVGIFWEFKDEEGRLVVVTLRQNEFSQVVPAPEIRENSGDDSSGN